MAKLAEYYTLNGIFFRNTDLHLQRLFGHFRGNIHPRKSRVKDLQLLGKEMRESLQYHEGRAPRNLLEAADLFDDRFSKLTGKTVRFERFLERF